MPPHMCNSEYSELFQRGEIERDGITVPAVQFDSTYAVGVIERF